MALTVEDGTRPTGANTYAALADANAYWADRGNAAWADATDDEKAAALIQATDYLNGLSWTGHKVAIRTMAWPRIDVEVDGYAVDSDEIPEEVVQACCYMAGEIIGGATPLAATDRPLTKLTAGPVNIEWDSASSQAPQYPALRSILRGYIMAGNTFRMVRA